MSKVRVPRWPLALGGWKGDLTIDGDVLRVAGMSPEKRISIDFSQVKKCSFNSNNGLWVFRMKTGEKIYLQTSGVLLSADRSMARRDANEKIFSLAKKYSVR